MIVPIMIVVINGKINTGMYNSLQNHYKLNTAIGFRPMNKNIKITIDLAG